jgi:ATP-dependent DNA helicase RecG
LPLSLEAPLGTLKSVGPARAAMLEAKGLSTVEDLLRYPPFRYEDRSNVKTIAQLAPGEMATILAEVRQTKVSGFRRKNLGLFEAEFTDASRSIVVCKWFNAAYLADKLLPGMKFALFGKVEFDSYRGELQIMRPELESLSGDDDGESSLHTGRIVPVYEAAGKVNTRVLRMLTHLVLAQLSPVEDQLPEALRHTLKLLSLDAALRQIHFPPPDSDLRLLNGFRSPAHFRLILEEFFWLECGLALKKSKARLVPGIAFARNEQIRERIKTLLPFKPTRAQVNALREIADDMGTPSPMNRLLHGDVGSGKTIVAAEAIVIAVENKFQAAVLAPTEILATQHYLSLQPLFRKLGYQVNLLTGSSKDKAEFKKYLAAGMVQVAIGTHALIEPDVEFHNLGLVIIDEQHRFGVMQRFHLGRKGVSPDVLVMTATPIPRTLAMTLYGDLDVSVIDELPPGRKPITTKHYQADAIEQVWSFVKQQVDLGRQAYVVYPVIEDSETQATKAAQTAHTQLSKEVFPHTPVALLHGRMPSAQKEEVMAAFKAGHTKILVATTVIEVGVDVPNATVMVIEQAERFGLSQLHQLRGRVGRGGEQSYCLLVTDKLTDTAKSRIRTMTETNDGFKIAEVDLQLRGPGEFFGTRQSGMPALKIASILRDREILEIARREALDFVARPPSREALAQAAAYIRDHWQRKYGLVQVG